MEEKIEGNSDGHKLVTLLKYHKYKVNGKNDKLYVLLSLNAKMLV